MSEVISPEVLAKLELLGQKLGANSSEVFGWYIKQQYITVLGFLAIAIFFGIVAYFCKKWYYNAESKQEDSEDATFAPTILGAIAVIISMGSIATLIFRVIGLFNVEYYAFQKLIDTISTLVP